MKKFMKAIAFALVMCLALSTVAFAEGDAVLGETEKVLNITVTGAGSDQVALVVVASDAADNDFSNPLYIDQKAADGSAEGKAEFTAVLTNADVTAVDVYVGYATYATDHTTPEKIGNDVAITKPVTEITVTKVACAIIQDVEKDNLKAEDQTGAGAWAIFNAANVPEGVELTQMIWAIRHTGEGKGVAYHKIANAKDYGIGSLLDGNVKLGVAFINGSDLHGINPVEITAIDAIFLFEGTDGFSQEVLTNKDDAANKVGAN